MLKNIFLIVSGGIIVFIIGVSFIQNNTDKKLEAIQNQRVQTNSGLEVATTTVDKFTGFLNNTSTGDYARSMSEMKDLMTEDIYKEYFPTKVYDGWNGYTAKENSKVSEKIDNKTYIFKVEYTFYNDQDEYNNTYLIKVNGKKIVEINSLGI